MAKVIFAGTVRDCEPHLPAVLRNIEQLSRLFEETACVFVENDSRDGTRQLLNSWGTSRAHFTLFDLAGLGQLPIRTLRLELARNVYLEFVRTEAVFATFDYLCVLDMDEVGAYPMQPQDLRAALDFMLRTENCAGVFANQLGTYYDLWALRHPQLCPDDVWYEVLSWAQRHAVTDQEAFEQTFAKRIRSFEREAPPLEVDSAFGGLGIYRLDFVRRNPNPYLGSRVRVQRRSSGPPLSFRMQQCEHVHFHAGLRHIGGRLFVLPGLINGMTRHNVSFPASAYRQMCF